MLGEVVDAVHVLEGRRILGAEDGEADHVPEKDEGGSDHVMERAEFQAAFLAVDEALAPDIGVDIAEEELETEVLVIADACGFDEGGKHHTFQVQGEAVEVQEATVRQVGVLLEKKRVHHRAGEIATVFLTKDEGRRFHPSERVRGRRDGMNPLVIMGIVDGLGMLIEDASRGPAERRSALRAPHLVTSPRPKDGGAAPGARTGLLPYRRHARPAILVARMVLVVVIVCIIYQQIAALGAGPRVAEAAHVT